MSQRSIARLVGGTVAAVGLIAASAGVAHATDPYKPTGGSTTFALKTGTSVTFTVDPSLTSMSCTTMTLSGSVTNSGVARPHSSPAGALTSLTPGGCTNSQLGGVAVTLTSPSLGVYVTGDASGGLWPSKITGVNATLDAVTADCVVTASGDISGNFNPAAVGTRAAQTFLATGSTLEIDTVTGLDCATLDILPGDPVAVSGTWVNTGTALSLSH